MKKTKNILISGASQGLGSYLTKELSLQNTKIAFFSRNKKELIKTYNACSNKKRHQYFIIDLQNLENIKTEFEKILKFLKRIDIVIHVAGGGLGVKKPFPDYNDYIKVFNLNLFSIMELNKYIVPNMIKNKIGSIIHIGSIASNMAVGSISYNTCKGALAAYVKSLSLELIDKNICVSGISPGGFIYNNNSMDRFKKNNFKEYNEFIKKRIPLKRMPKAREMMPIFNMLCFNHNMTLSGSLISCDSGENKSYDPIRGI